MRITSITVTHSQSLEFALVSEIHVFLAALEVCESHKLMEELELQMPGNNETHDLLERQYHMVHSQLQKQEI